MCVKSKGTGKNQTAKYGTKGKTYKGVGAKAKAKRQAAAAHVNNK